MATFSIDLPESSRQLLDRRAREAGFASTADYLVDLIRRDEAIERAERELADMMQAGIDSGDPVPIGPGHWDKRRDALRKA